MRTKKKSLTADTGILSVAMILRAVSQGVSFIIIARMMGVSSYGSFISLVALSTGLAHISGLGVHILMKRDIARHPENFNKAWGNTLLSFVLTVPVVFALYLLAVDLFLNFTLSWIIIVLIGLSDIVLSALNNFCASAYQGSRRMGRASRVMLLPSICRLIGSFVFVLLVVKFQDLDKLLTWACIYFLSVFASAVYIQLLVLKDLGKPSFEGVLSAMRMASVGYPFSIWGFSEKINLDADKIMLARMQSVEVAGVYSVAHRLVDFAIVPTQGLLKATAPDFYTIKTTKNTLSYATSLLKYPFVYSLILAVAFYQLADISVILVGEEYTESASIIKFFCLLPVLLLFRYFIQQVVAACDLQSQGARIIIVCTIVNVLLNIILISQWGWQGAIVSTYISEVLTIALLYKLVAKQIDNQV